MATEFRTYDNEHGDPVVVLVTTGTHDVSRLVQLLNSGRCEDVAAARDITAAVRRHNGGRAALQLLAAHGGPDLLFPAGGMSDAEARLENIREMLDRLDEGGAYLGTEMVRQYLPGGALG